MSSYSPRILPSQEWTNLLHKTTIHDLVRERKIKKLVTFQDDKKLFDCLELLASNDILSAPVVSHENKFLGFVDVIDIANYVLQTLTGSTPVIDRTSFEKITSTFFNTNIYHLLNSSDANSSLFASSRTTVPQLFLMFQTCQNHPQRIALIDPKGDLNMVTQTDLIVFIYKHRKSLGRILHQTVDELKIAKACILVRSSASLVDALASLHSHRISGLALVDEFGRFSGNFSASDLRSIRPFIFANLSWTIKDFLSRSSKPHDPVICDFESTLEEILKLMITNKVHRVYVLNNNQQPVGVITMQNIIEII